MNLMKMPDDILVEMIKLLDVVDVVILRRVSPRLNHLSRVRTIWSNAFRRVCKQQGVALPTELHHYSEATLEYYACRPARFQSIAASLATRSAKPIASRPQFSLPIPPTSKVHLVKGGRWLLDLSATGILSAWDLEPWLASRPGASLDFSGGPASSSTSSADNRYRLCAQSCYDPQGLSLMDAVATPDGVHLNVLLYRSSENQLSSSMVVLALDLSDDMHDTEPTKRFDEVSSWDSLDWVHDSGAFYSFGTDVVLLARRDIQQPVWLWNWRTSQRRKMLLQVPHATKTDYLSQAKIVSDALLAVHCVNGKTCMISAYPLPRLDLDYEPVLVDDLSASLPSSSLSPHACDDQPYAAEPLAFAFTSKFYDLAHPSGPRPKPRPDATYNVGVPKSLKLGFQTTCLGLGSEGTFEPINLPPFIPGKVTISEPLWTVPPAARRAEAIHLRDGSVDPGVFQVAIAVESIGDGATVRTRLHYTLRVDLKVVADAVEEGDSGYSTRTTIGMDISTLADKLRLPKIRGRMSFPGDSMRNQTTSIVMPGNMAVVSVWNAPDGVHMQSSSIKSSMGASTAVTSSVRRSASPERQPHAKLSVRKRPRSPASAMSSNNSPTTSTVREDDRRLRDHSSKASPPLGRDAIIYTWPERKLKKTSGLGFDPAVPWQAIALSMFANQQVEVRRSWSTMDSISGRLIVSDDDESCVQVVDYL